MRRAIQDCVRVPRGSTSASIPIPPSTIAERPLGPARFQHATTDEVYRAILEQRPFAVHGLVGFGSNLLRSQANGGLGQTHAASRLATG